MRLAEELKRNEKERAEHVMLVDLGRNDVGRVCDVRHRCACRPTWRSSATRTSCTWSRSSKGKLADDHDRLDALVACFPAGTVSGAPKVRAMEIIAELEPAAAASTPARSATSTSPAISTSASPSAPSLIENGTAYVQAGAGIVADSNPTAEYEETRDKARRA